MVKGGALLSGLNPNANANFIRVKYATVVIQYYYNSDFLFSQENFLMLSKFNERRGFVLLSQFKIICFCP